MAMGHLDGIERFAQSPYLVYLDEDGVGTAHFNTFAQEFHVGNKEVVAHQLAAMTDALGQLFPAFPVVLAHTVLNGVDGILVDKFLQVGNLLVHAQLLAVRVFGHAVLQVRVVVVELAVLLHA